MVWDRPSKGHGIITRSTLSPSVCLLALLLASWGDGVLASSYVVAVIDPDRVVERSPQYEAARRELQQAVADREKKLREQQEELTALQERLEREYGLSIILSVPSVRYRFHLKDGTVRDQIERTQFPAALGLGSERDQLRNVMDKHYY